MKDTPIEGMPGTWSHCGSHIKHSSHRHTIVVNEGPYPNVLCLGYPGDPNGRCAASNDRLQMTHLQRLWVDDLRPAPSGWIHVISSADALLALAYNGPWNEMSLDHDLGGDDTARSVVLWLCENPEHWPDEVHVHSQNPVGALWLTQMIERYKP